MCVCVYIFIHEISVRHSRTPVPGRRRFERTSRGCLKRGVLDIQWSFRKKKAFNSLSCSDGYTFKGNLYPARLLLGESLNISFMAEFRYLFFHIDVAFLKTLKELLSFAGLRRLLCASY